MSAMVVDPDIERAGLALMWLAVAWACGYRALKQSSPAWWTCFGLGLVLTSIPVFRWNVALLHAGQRVLRGMGAYEHRVSIKIAILVLGLLLVLLLLRMCGRRLFSLGAGARRTLWPMIAASVYLAILTLSLENFLPSGLVQPPGRFVVEYVLGATALLGLILPRRVSNDPG